MKHLSTAEIEQTANLQDCYLYCRVSGLTQADTDLDGLPRQETAGRTFAVREGYNVVRVFRDAVSGTKEQREAFCEMREAMLANGVKTVLIEKLDRLARDLLLQETILADFQKNGITLLSTMEPDLGSNEPSRKFFRQIMGAVAEYDRAIIVSRMKAGKARARAKGKRCGGRAAYPSPRHPEEVEVVNRVYHLRGNGFNAAKIAAILNSEGHLTRKGTAFQPMQVSRIISRTQNSLKGKSA